MSELIAEFAKSLMWPFPQIIDTFRLRNAEPPSRVEFKVPRYLDAPGHARASGAAFRNSLIAVFFVCGLYNDGEYPAYGAAYFLNFSWMWPIIVRDVIATWILCGFWDWWLYFGPLKDTIFKYKIVPKYPSKAQMFHDMLYTTQAAILAGVLEIILCHLWATGTIPMAESLWDKPFLHLFLALTVRHGRDPHFYLIHRMIHPWRINGIPDVGKFLYRHAHCVHHKSNNITAFSGTNMHPIEVAIYYSSALLTIPLGVHPCIPVAYIVDLQMAAWHGHDGHISPAGTGNAYHTMHHMHFDCNYGTPMWPFDVLFGTYAAKKEDIKKIWGKDSGEEEANETVVPTNSPPLKSE